MLHPRLSKKEERRKKEEKKKRKEKKGNPALAPHPRTEPSPATRVGQTEVLVKSSRPQWWHVP
jgi:hypothetical protein